jgi:hypothetical protein
MSNADIVTTLMFYLVLCLTASVAWWDNWTVYQTLVALNLEWAVHLLFQIRKAVDRGPRDRV